jgi:molybdopterin converting factor small subunit
MMVRVRLFAAAQKHAGREVVELAVDPACTVGALRAALVDQVPTLREIAPHLLFAVDRQYAADNCRIGPESEVAGFPPVSGG